MLYIFAIGFLFTLLCAVVEIIDSNYDHKKKLAQAAKVEASRRSQIESALWQLENPVLISLHEREVIEPDKTEDPFRGIS